MRVVIDWRMGQADRVGFGVYLRGLVPALARCYPADEFVLLTASRLPPPELAPQPNVCIEAVAPTFQEYLARDRWEQWRLARVLTDLGADVYHSPHYTLPFIRPAPCPAVVTLYDASLFVMPHVYRARHTVRVRYLVGRAVRRADGVIFGSRHAQSEFERVFPDALPALRRAIHIGVPEDIDAPAPPSEAAVAAVLARHGVRRPYIVAVGSVQPRKNYPRLVEALTRPALAGHQLVIVGAPAWKGDEVDRAISRHGLAGRVKVTGFVPTDDLRALIRGAAVMAFPSLYEGFGIPPLEAFALGTPVAASDASSIPEVVGDAAEMFDPNSVSAMAGAIARVAVPGPRRLELVERGRERLATFSWRRCADEHMEVYRRAVHAGIPEQATRPTRRAVPAALGHR